MFQAFLIKYAEIGIKGKNRYLFEDALVQHMVRVLKEVDGHFVVSREMGRIYVNAEGNFDYGRAVEALKRVFGIVGICPVVITEDEGYEKLEEAVGDYVGKVYPDRSKTFKICARRANKNYPMNSMKLNMVLG